MSQLEAIDGQSAMHWKSETSQHLPIIGLVSIIDGILTKQELSSLIHQRLVSNPSYHRFKSVLLPSGYFKSIDSFDVNRVLKVFRPKIKHKHQTLIIDTDGTSSGSSSDSDNNTPNGIDYEYYVMEQYLSSHISKYHNYAFKKPHKLPLWRGHLIQFPHLNKTIFYIKCHHGVCDGMSLSKLILTLADNFKAVNEENNKLILRSKSYQQFQQRWDRPMLYILFLIINCTLWLLDFCWMVLVHSEKPSIITPKQSNLKKSYSVLYNISTDHLDKARKSQTSSKKNVTINDYLLAVISEGLSSFIADHDNKDGKLNEIIKAGTVITMNTRDPLSVVTKTEINCSVGCTQIYMPLCDEKVLSFDAKLDYIKKQMDNIKARGFALFSCFLLGMTGYFPKWMIAFLIKLQNASVIVSNIRGPKDTLFLNGNEIISAAGVVQNNPGISLSFCVTGYNGKCSISLLSDVNISGDKTSQKIMKYIADVLKTKKCL